MISITLAVVFQLLREQFLIEWNMFDSRGILRQIIILLFVVARSAIFGHFLTINIQFNHFVYDLSALPFPIA
jgi:hypothetical protein